MAGISLTLAAALLGGSRVPLDGELQSGPFLGLDWFLLNLMVYSAVFIPLERLSLGCQNRTYSGEMADRSRATSSSARCWFRSPRF